MNEINMPADEFGKSVLGVIAGVTREQLQITGGGGVAHSQQYIATRPGNPTRNFERPKIGRGKNVLSY